MKDGIPQLADKVATTGELYSFLSHQLDALNGMLIEAGASCTFEHSGDDKALQIRKISDGGAEEIASIESLGSDNELGSELYATRFGDGLAVRRSAIGAMTFLKNRLIESLDVDTKIKLPGADAAPASNGFLRAILLGIENDPWKIAHQVISDEMRDLNAKLERVKAPFKFGVIYNRDVLAINSIENDGGGETVAFVEPLDDLPAFKISYDETSDDLTLPGAVGRVKQRAMEFVPADVAAALARLDGPAGGKPQPSPPG
jgi:hypothetical protein